MNDGFFGSFNAGAVEYKTGYDTLPNGTYCAVIAKGENKTSQSGNNYLSFTWEIIEGEYTGRKLFSNYNVYHNDPKVRQIAMNDMAGICQAISVLQPQGVEELCDKPMMIEVGVRKDKDTGELKNVIKKYMPAGGTVGNASVQTNTNKKPWER